MSKTTEDTPPEPVLLATLDDAITDMIRYEYGDRPPCLSRECDCLAMPGWEKTREDRQRDAKVYGSPEYKRNREAARRRAGGRCEGCGHRHLLECDHIIPTTQGGTHALANLRMLCKGPGTCQCHDRKTATEGGRRRSRGSSDPAPRPRTAW